MAFWQVFSRQISIKKHQSTLKQRAWIKKKGKNKIAPISSEQDNLTITCILG